ncbi:phosphate ABC transporter permease PstA [Desulfonatronovibrio hydrogenovorans]|nr:phosphate ABC transporter permease PstA [Desulfonatronovibrio hydrogenovorans]
MRFFLEKFFTAFAWLATFTAMSAIFILIGFLALRGYSTINLELFFGQANWLKAITGAQPVFGGLWPAMAGTIALVLLSCSIAIPVGVAAGIYLSEYASPKIQSAAGFAVDLMAGIPSIVMGLFGFSIIILLKNTFLPQARTCLMLAAVCIALLVMPYLIRTTQNSLQSISEERRLLGISLGFSTWQNIRHILLPSSSKGILSGIILSIGRAAEDTAVILLTGVVSQAFVPRSLWDKFEAIPFRIYYLAAEHRSSAELEQAYGAALVLLIITGLLFILAFLFQKSIEKKWIIR